VGTKYTKSVPWTNDFDDTVAKLENRTDVASKRFTAGIIAIFVGLFFGFLFSLGLLHGVAEPRCRSELARLNSLTPEQQLAEYLETDGIPGAELAAIGGLEQLASQPRATFVRYDASSWWLHRRSSYTAAPREDSGCVFSRTQTTGEALTWHHELGVFDTLGTLAHPLAGMTFFSALFVFATYWVMRFLLPSALDKSGHQIAWDLASDGHID
jgi:hypothetical protein